jgi:hypothetical protein
MRNGCQSTWLNFVKNVLDNGGLNNIWLSQGNFNFKWLSENLKRNLKDQFIQKWRSDMENSSKDICYRLFKENFEFETYLDILSDKDRITLCKFRTCNHRLPIEIGRWQNVDRSDRISHICQTAEIGDEFHYILQCRQLHNDRKLYLKKNSW